MSRQVNHNDWFSWIQQSVHLPNYNLHDEVMLFPALTTFFSGEWEEAGHAARSILCDSDGAVLPLLSDRQFLYLFYDLIFSIDENTPAYLIAMILRRFQQLSKTVDLHGVPNELFRKMCERIQTIVTLAWADKNRRDRYGKWISTYTE